MEQRHQALQQAESEKRKETVRPPSSHNCPRCGAANPPEAAFCAECGTALAGKPCPSCGQPTKPGADICEHCGAWLLEGQCVFCYAPIDHGAAFCPECGLPQAGIVCPKCGTTCRFDFCSSCGEALTDPARAMLAQARSDPALNKALEELREPARLTEEMVRLDAELQALEVEASADAASAGVSAVGAAGAESDPAAAPAAGRRRGMSDALKRSLGESVAPKKPAESVADVGAAARALAAKLAENANRAADLRKQRDELVKRKSQAETNVRVVDTFKQFKALTFATSHDARRFHMANRPPNAIGWHCNYADYFHPVPEGPNGCHCPELGGVWIFDT